jgi:hypothetical protein
MANCALLLNNGASFLLLNDGSSILLLNDNSCTDVVHDVFAEESRHHHYGKYHIHQVRALSERERDELKRQAAELEGAKPV